MIKAIIFDCFGVLTSDNWQEFHDTHLAHDIDKSKRATEINRLSDQGAYSYDEWVAHMAKLADLSEEQVRRERGVNVDNVELLEYIKQEISPNYTTAILSNVGRGFRTEMFRGWQGTIFDTIILSCDTGAVKPDGEAFEVAIEKLNVAPSDSIFIDDKLENVAAAERMGMKGIHYGDFATLKTKLQALLREG